VIILTFFDFKGYGSPPKPHLNRTLGERFFSPAFPFRESQSLLLSLLQKMKTVTKEIVQQHPTLINYPILFSRIFQLLFKHLILY
jgi:hypothetical protein